MLRPDGSPLPLVWGDRPDIATAHAAVDAWAAAACAVDRLPRVGGYSLWWILRVKMAQTHLTAWLPLLRALRGIPPPAALRLHAPPAPWWPDLLAAASPGVALSIASRQPAPRLERAARIGARALRAAATARRLRDLPPKRAGAVRVLAVSRARSWDGARDIEIGGVIDALAARGAEVVVLEQSHEGMAGRLHGWRTRPGDHLFGDYFFWDHARRHRGLPRTPRIDLGNAPPMILEGADLGPVFLAQLLRETASFAQGHGVCVDAVPGFARRLGVDAALTVDENGGEMGLVRGLKAAGVPVVALQHGCIHPDHLSYVFPPGTPPDAIPLCDVTCVYGDHYARLLTGTGIYPDAAVRATGQPRNDARRREGQTETAARLRSDTLPPGCDRLLLLSSQELLVDDLRDRLLPAFAASHPRHFLVVRPHPREWGGGGWDTALAAHSLRDRAAVRAGDPLDPWLAACDVHLAATSTTLAEAAIFDRPNILLGARAHGDWMACLAGGVAVDLADFPGLDAAVAHWLDADAGEAAAHAAARAAYVREHFGALDGGAAARVAEAVIACAGGGP